MENTAPHQNLLTRLLHRKEVVLHGVARVLSPNISPNAITAVRCLLIIPIIYTYRQGALGWTIILFLLALGSDALDGVQARFYGKVTNFGKLFDPFADKLLFVGLFLFVAPHRLSQAAIISILSLEAILVLLAIALGPLAKYFFHIERKIGANSAGKIKMTIEGIAVTVLLLGPSHIGTRMAAEILIWLAVAAAIVSIALHLIQRENKNLPS